MKVTVRAPATVANLGPGFDCLGLALDLSGEFTVDTQGRPGVTVEGEGADELPADESNLVMRAMRAAAERDGAELPSLFLRCLNHIPLERGLGSSAAAVVAGILLAQANIDEGLDRLAALDLAVEIEGHADNVAACLLGGLTLAYRAGGRWRAERVEPHPDLHPVLFVPEHRVATAEARQALPPSVPFADAAFNAGRAALVVRALTERPDLLLEAMDDRLHQDVRLSLAPASRELFDRLRGSGWPVCVAGAGPSLLAFRPSAQHQVDPGPGWRVLRPAVAREGANVVAST